MQLTEVLHLAIDGMFFGRPLTGLTGGSKVVGAIVVTNPGAGYQSPPTISFTGGGGGTGLAATAELLSNSVIRITITNPGSGYTTAPGVVFTGGGFTTVAQANAILLPETLDAIPTASRSLTPALVVQLLLSGQVNFYRLRAGTDAENSPSIIRPDDYAGTTNEKVWELCGVFVGDTTILDGENIVLGTVTGTKIGTSTAQKLGLFNKTPVIQPAHANQAAVTLVNVDGAIGGLTISAAYSQAEVQALRDATEVLADDVRALSTLLHALRTAGIDLGTWKGAA